MSYYLFYNRNNFGICITADDLEEAKERAIELFGIARFKVDYDREVSEEYCLENDVPIIFQDESDV